MVVDMVVDLDSLLLWLIILLEVVDLEVVVVDMVVDMVVDVAEMDMVVVVAEMLPIRSLGSFQRGDCRVDSFRGRRWRHSWREKGKLG